MSGTMCYQCVRPLMWGRSYRVFRTEDPSPNTPDAIAFEDAFICDDRHIFCLCLRNEHAVKGVFVGAWQEASPNTMLCRNSE